MQSPFGFWTNTGRYLKWSGVESPARTSPLTPVSRLPEVDPGDRCHAFEFDFFGTPVCCLDDSLLRSDSRVARGI